MSEELKKLESILDDVCGAGGAMPVNEPIYTISLTEIAEAFRRLKAGQSEAVAWRWTWKECREDDGWTYRESPPFDPTTVVVQALYLAPPASADAVLVMEQCAKWCDERAAYYEGDDDGPEGRRNIACKACASVIRYHAANKVDP